MALRRATKAEQAKLSSAQLSSAHFVPVASYARRIGIATRPSPSSVGTCPKCKPAAADVGRNLRPPRNEQRRCGLRGGGCTSSKSTTILDISIVKLRSSSYCHTCGRARSPKHTMAGEHASCLPNDTHRRMSGADRGVVARWYCEQLVNIDRLRAHQVIQILTQARASLREMYRTRRIRRTC